MSLASLPRTRRWDRGEYERMIETGILGPEDRVELLEGEIVEMSPEGSRHATAVDLGLESRRRASAPVSPSESSIRRARKARICAECGISAYWIVNRVDERLEVHRDPGPGGYRSLVGIERGQAISPLAAPTATIDVSDLLP